MPTEILHRISRKSDSLVADTRPRRNGTLDVVST